MQFQGRSKGLSEGFKGSQSRVRVISSFYERARGLQGVSGCSAFSGSPALSRSFQEDYMRFHKRPRRFQGYHKGVAGVPWEFHGCSRGFQGVLWWSLGVPETLQGVSVGFRSI